MPFQPIIDVETLDGDPPEYSAPVVHITNEIRYTDTGNKVKVTLKRIYSGKPVLCEVGFIEGHHCDYRYEYHLLSERIIAGGKDCNYVSQGESVSIRRSRFEQR